MKDIRAAYSQLKDNTEDQRTDLESSLTRENVEGKSSPVTAPKSEKQDYTNDNQTLEVKLYQAQVRTVFGLQVLGSLTVSPVTHVSCLTCHLVPYHTLPYHTIPHHATPWHTVPYHTTPYHTMPHHAIPHLTTPCHTTPCHTIPKRIIWSEHTHHIVIIP